MSAVTGKAARHLAPLALLATFLTSCAAPRAPLAPGNPAPDTPLAAVQVDLRLQAGDRAVQLLPPGDRAVQFDGGYGSLQNDIAHLVVGIFDNGTKPSLGYLLAGDIGTVPVASALSGSAATYLLPDPEGIASKLGTAGTGAAASGLSITSDKANVRRFGLNDFGAARNFVGRLTTLSFKNLPQADGTAHQYLVFAAAYRGDDVNLGYTEAAVADSLTQGGDAKAVQLTLNLKQGVFTNQASASLNLVAFPNTATASLHGPLLAAIHQPVASAGTTINLEGQFTAPRATVNFPGGVTAEANVLGTRRATVTVPSGATSGDLTISIVGQISNALPFRVPTFTLGLGSFRPRLEQAGYGRQPSALGTARGEHASVVLGDYLYVLGGWNNGALNSVERARIFADGTLGAFAATSNLTSARNLGSAVVVGKHLYAIGGYGGSTLATVERASLNPDGTLGAFSPVSSALGTARYGHASMVAGGYLYVLGGYASGNALTSVEAAPMDSYGNLGPFAAAGNLAIGRYGLGAAVIRNHVYALGGFGSGYLNSVERAPIKPDGTLGAFAAAGATMLTARSKPACAVIGDALWVAGGVNDSGETSSIERAVVGTDESLGAFAAAGILPAARQGMAAAVAGGHLYLTGGFEAGVGYVGSVDRATINASGNLGSFAASGVTLAAGRRWPGVVVVGNNLYVVGGRDAGPTTVASVEKATINRDGTIGAFANVAGVTLADASFRHAMAVIGNYVYAVGGYDSSPKSAVQRASINADGTISTFGTVPGVTLQVARHSHAIAVVGNYLYVFGGNDGPSFLTSVERATINADGTISTFSTVSSVTLTIGRDEVTAFVNGNYLYALGGHVTDTSVDRATINADGTIGNFAQVGGLSLTIARKDHAVAVAGNKLYVLGGLENGAPRSSVEVATINADGTLGNFAAAGSLPDTVQSHRAVVLGNYLYSIGGISGAGPLDRVERAVLQ